MPKVESIPHGAPIWMDLSTSNLEKATAFYGALFGWTSTSTGDEFGGYTIARLGEDMVAGMMQKTEEDLGPDAWTVYLATDDAKATAEAIKANGGELVLDPMQVGPLGVMTVLADPTGAFLGTWQPGEHKGFEVYGEEGAPAWHELMTLDFETASTFYTNAFGVALQDMSGEGGPAYRVFSFDGDFKAGLMDANGLMPEGVPSNWLVYWGANDTDAKAAEAVALGGTILAPPADTPWGRFALIGDPTGAVFALISMDGEGL